MMKIFKISALCAVALFMAFGCQKTVDVTPVFVEKTFFPMDEADAVSRVKTFLAAVEASKTGERTTFSDMEVNEGRWTLEGSVNYEKNANLANEGLNSVETYTLSINNIVVNNTIQMSGTDMTNKYAAFLATVNAEETASGRTATLADLKITSATNSTTEIEATVVFTVPEIPSIQGITWPRAAILIGKGIPNWFTANGCIAWTPDPQFVGTPIMFATSRLGTGDINYPDYAVQWLPADIAEANQIITNFIAANQSVYNQNIPPGQASGGGAWHYAGGAFIQAKEVGLTKRHYLGSMAIAQYHVCF